MKRAYFFFGVLTGIAILTFPEDWADLSKVMAGSLLYLVMFLIVHAFDRNK